MESVVTVAVKLSDAELLSRVIALASRERDATVELVAHLAELDRRKLYRAEGFSSLFSYCTKALGLSEPAAYRRIVAARLSRRVPEVLARLASGSISLSTLCVIAPHLSDDNCGLLLTGVEGKGKREAEALVARLFPQEDVPASLRKLPSPNEKNAPLAATVSPALMARAAEATALPLACPPVAASALHRPTIAALAPERYRVQFTIGRETQEKLRQAQDLLRRELPDGDLAAIFDRALTLLLQDIARRKVAASNSPRKGRDVRPGSRHIPAEVKRRVWLRDAGRCAFVAGNGRRCDATAFLEFHHVHPYALGGEPTVENVALRCREHNLFEAGLVFGPSLPVVNEPRPHYTVGLGSRVI